MLSGPRAAPSVLSARAARQGDTVGVTAKYLADGLPKVAYAGLTSLRAISVTGELGDEERRERITELVAETIHSSRYANELTDFGKIGSAEGTTIMARDDPDDKESPL